MKKAVRWAVGLLFIAVIAAVGYSIFREEWYSYDKKVISEFMDCSQKDITEIYNEAVRRLEGELRNYDLTEAVFIIDGDLEQIDFLFYRPGFFYDVNTKMITVLPRENLIQSVEEYKGNFKASEVDDPVTLIDAEELSQIYRENAGDGEVKKIIYDGDGVRVYPSVSPSAYGADTGELQWKWIIKPDAYEDLAFVAEDRIAVKDQSGKYALANMQGGLLTVFRYDSIDCYREGIAAVRSDGLFFYIDGNGDAVSENTYEGAYRFGEGAGAVKREGCWGFVDKAGEMLIPCQYSEVRSFQEERAAVKTDGKWGYIDKEGVLQISEQFEEATDFCEGRAAVKADGRWGFADREGNLICDPIYEEVHSFQEGYAAVMSGGKWGFVDLRGDLCIACVYDAVEDFSEGKAAVKKADYRDGLDAWAYIDRQGRTVIDFYPYDAAGDSFYSVGKFQNGYAFVSKTLCVVIDEEGNDVFRDSYFFISAPWYNPEYNVIPGYVYTDPEMTVRKYGMAGINGEQRIEPVFDGIDSMSGKYIIVSEYCDGRLRKGLIEVGMPDKGRLTVGGSGAIIASFPRS
ncbi:MAG: WG repeat-containing protein [Ruminococcus flavefaciens]|nr:WG repeat-containing protein [Ruminococcus flavefaciens]